MNRTGGTARDDLSVCVIGGGSTYTPELIDGFIAARDALPVRRVTLVDIDPQRLDVVGGLAARMLHVADAEIELETTCDRVEGLHGADYVIAQVRIGGMAARIRDERIPLALGVVGQETTGPGGFACALRTIPPMLEIAADITRVAPDARLINFTNPSGLITEAIATHTKVDVVGLCNSPLGIRHAVAELFASDPERIGLDVVGLNHLTWVRGVTLDRRDVTDEAIERAITRGLFPRFAPKLLRALRMLPNTYLDYYYNTDRVLGEQAAAPRTRGETVLEIERGLLRAYADPTLARTPERLGERGGAHYSTAALSLIRALETDVGGVHIVNTTNRGALPDLPDGAVVELPCHVSRQGVRPLRCAPLPPEIRGLVASVKAYEELTIRAAVEGDERAALLALTVHPLVPSFEIAKRLWEEIRKANKGFLPQFGGSATACQRRRSA